MTGSVSIRRFLKEAVRRPLRRRGGQRRYYHDLVMQMALAICIAAFLAGAPILHILADNEISRANAENVDNLRLIAARLDDIMYSLEKQSLLLTQGRNVQEILSKTSFSQNIRHGINLFNEIRLYKNNSDFVEEIFFYNNSMSGIFSNRYGYLDSDSELYAGMAYLAGLERPTGWYRPPHMESDDYIAFYRKILRFQDSDPQGILVFYMSKQALLPYLSGGAGSLGGISFVLDSDNNILLSSDNVVGEHGALETALSGVVLDDMRLEEPQISTVRLGGRVYLAAGIKKFSGKTYLSLIERNQARSSVYGVLATMLISMAFAIGVGVLYAVMNARKLYLPVRELFLKSRELGASIPFHNHEILYISECVDYLDQEARALKQYTIEARSKLREDFLGQLLTKPLPQAEAYPAAEEYLGFSISADGQYAVIVFHSSLTPQLREHVAALAVGASFSVDRIVGKKNSLAVIGCFPASAVEEEILGDCRRFAGEVAEAFPQPIRVGIGTVQQLGGLSSSYRDAMLGATEYAACPGGEASGAQHPKTQPEGIHFVHSFAERLVRGARDGDEEALKAELERFVREILRTDSGNYALQMFKMLLADMLFLIDSQSGSQAAELLEQELFYLLNECESVDEARDCFERVLFPRITRQNYRARQQEYAISRVREHIQENIRGDITLAGCAEHAELSPSYLSKRFKKETGVSFSDYVLERKMEEAKSLLLATDLKISEIADVIGYSPRSLYRQFVRLTGRSPNEFRKEAGQRP